MAKPEGWRSSALAVEQRCGAPATLRISVPPPANRSTSPPRSHQHEIDPHTSSNC